MASKDEIQDTLKTKYGINKNITQSLSLEDCKDLLISLESQSSATKVINLLVKKNEELGHNNRNFGKQRSAAQKKLKSLEAEYEKLEKTIENLEKRNQSKRDRKDQLSEEQEALEAQIQQLAAQNQALSSKIQNLTTQNDELLDANEKLKKDNKDLKNIVDQIRLRLARDTKMLLDYEDSEIRKALIRLFQWTLG